MSSPSDSFAVYRVLRRRQAPRLVAVGQGEKPPGGAKLIKDALTMSLAEAMIRRLERVELEAYRLRNGIESEEDGASWPY